MRLIPKDLGYYKKWYVMGRPYTGSATIRGAQKLKLSLLLRYGNLQPGKITESIINWEHSGAVMAKACFTDIEKYLQLIYTAGGGKEIDYKIHLDCIPSNIGKGEIIYFLCPVTGARCRVLYKTYGSDIFKSRQAYSNRIYYELQQTSKNWLQNTKYWNLESRIKELQKMRFTDTYNGRKTKRALLLQRLIQEQAEADRLRLINLAGAYMLRHIFGGRKTHTA